MPKHEFLTPKAIANRIKAKGLQKLKWYCQMCEKQCRDENGYQCHIRSESHLRQMGLLRENPNAYQNSYSKEFLDDFVKLLSRRWGTKRVQANLVYQEYISDRHHLHMNATQWITLTDFVKHLGKQGVCTVDETPKGWFIAWIDNSPKALARQEAILKKERQEKDEEERAQKMIEEQIERAQKEADSVDPSEKRELSLLKPKTEKSILKVEIKSFEDVTFQKEPSEKNLIRSDTNPLDESSANALNIALVPDSAHNFTSPIDSLPHSESSLFTTPNLIPTTSTTSISFKPTQQKRSLAALVKKSNAVSVPKKEKEPKKLSAMEEIILEETERKKRLEGLNVNGKRSILGMGDKGKNDYRSGYGDRGKDDYRDNNKDRNTREKEDRKDSYRLDRDRERDSNREGRDSYRDTKDHRGNDREYRDRQTDRERNKGHDLYNRDRDRDYERHLKKSRRD
ncbi:hypothetical protein G9A89_005908 [Geosiphon pyriformis]|nr:hypothetical protein G9A89_005908 [Geosiphon pyriformis]